MSGAFRTSIHHQHKEAGGWVYYGRYKETVDSAEVQMQCKSDKLTLEDKQRVAEYVLGKSTQDGFRGELERWAATMGKGESAPLVVVQGSQYPVDIPTPCLSRSALLKCIGVPNAYHTSVYLFHYNCQGVNITTAMAFVDRDEVRGQTEVEQINTPDLRLTSATSPLSSGRCTQ
jgi:hypothetical protein